MAKDGVEANAKRQAEATHKELVEQIKTQRADGLVDRSKALEKVAGENPLVWWMYGLFMLLECLAFLVKMFSRADEYDLRVDRMRQETGNRFAKEDLEERATARAIVLDDLTQEQTQRQQLVAIANGHADTTKTLLAYQANEVDQVANYLARIAKSAEKMKAAGLPTKVRDEVVKKAHGNVEDIRKFRA